MALRRGGVVNWLHADHLGSVSETTSAAGGRIAQERYYPYGRVRWGSAPTSYNFTGQRLDTSTGLLFFQARYYDPDLRRFLQPDTMVPEPGNPQSLNRFAYTLNNPLKYTDPDGHCPRPPADRGPALCVALFIMPPKVSAAGGMWTVHGDGRTFGPDSDPAKSRGYIWIYLDDDAWEWHMNPTGYIGYAHTEWFEPSELNKWNVTRGSNGEYIVDYDLVIAGPLEQISPHINGRIIFLPDGKGGYTAYGVIDGFPWVEAYYYNDAEGIIQTIFQKAAINGDPENLNWWEESIYEYPDWWHIYWWRRRNLYEIPVENGIKPPALPNVICEPHAPCP